MRSDSLPHAATPRTATADNNRLPHTTHTLYSVAGLSIISSLLSSLLFHVHVIGVDGHAEMFPFVVWALERHAPPFEGTRDQSCLVHPHEKLMKRLPRVLGYREEEEGESPMLVGHGIQNIPVICLLFIPSSFPPPYPSFLPLPRPLFFLVLVSFT